ELPCHLARQPAEDAAGDPNPSAAAERRHPDAVAGDDTGLLGDARYVGVDQASLAPLDTLTPGQAVAVIDLAYVSSCQMGSPLRGTTHRPIWRSGVHHATQSDATPICELSAFWATLCQMIRIEETASDVGVRPRTPASTWLTYSSQLGRSRFTLSGTSCHPRSRSLSPRRAATLSPGWLLREHDVAAVSGYRCRWVLRLFLAVRLARYRPSRKSVTRWMSRGVFWMS